MRIVNPVGKRGEDLAVEYLKKKKYKILDRNYRKQYGEIDIIAIDNSQKDPVLVFIEVKTRTSTQFGTPFEAITSWKIKPLLKTAQLYVINSNTLPQAQRMDAISIVLGEKREVVSIEHLENITEF